MTNKSSAGKKSAAIAVGVAFLAACSTVDPVRTATTLATSRDPEAALRAMAQSRATSYERDPRILLNDLKSLQRDYEKLQQALFGKASGTWGKKDTRLPSRTQYVKYSQSYKSRAVVDFDAGAITVETLDEANPQASLKNAIVTTLLTPDDPRAVDLFTDKPVKLTSDRSPYLLGLVVDAQGKQIATPEQAEAFADQAVAKDLKTRSTATEQGGKKALYVRIPMVANFQNKQAEKYKPAVEKYAAKYKVSPSLVYAVIRTESNFNPFAVSSAPAYGMMQLVPSSGGREAFRAAKGKDEMPTRDYLFDAENNIELGSAYLGVLFDKQLDLVQNPVSREYCVISAYNTGPGNVLKSFSPDRVAAVNAINKLEPPGVYDRLRTHLPYAETRDYLVKVVGYRRQFLTFGN